MDSILIGALLIVAGVVLAAINTIKRGRLSKPPEEGPGNTLEPAGRGRKLSVMSDLPGIALFVIGAILLLTSL